MIDPALLSRQLVDRLAAAGDLPSAWEAAFRSVPRHAFIPEIVWRQDDGIDDDNDMGPLRRAEQPMAWLELAYADDAVVTQVDDGRPAGPDLNGNVVTSSASMPTVVARMLAALQVDSGMTVCEIGTGTGYNAALLAHRLGTKNVTTVEIDERLARQARQALADAGYGGVSVVIADGERGHPPGAPFDRILATAAVHTVPYAWVAQTRPGGLVVTPWATAYYNGGLLSLRVADDGTATGRIVDRASFMALRDQRLQRVSVGRCVHNEPSATTTSTNLHPHDVAGDFDVSIAVGIGVQRCKRLYWPAGYCGDEAILWLLDPWSGSWAALHHEPEIASDNYRVRQLGPRRLWDEIEAAYRRWAEAGRPTADRWRFRVTPRSQHIWLDDNEC